ncbi:MAG: hypothetical protein KF893_26260 [Caldilineaceae bacterium]|nr:hypothetical protein [Caldilineaceae bacterium]
MHRHLYTQCRIQLELEARSPILVQGEQRSQTASFHRAIDPSDGKEKYVIPATSLKGVWRSTAERILRSADAHLACNPFEESGPGRSCSKRLEETRYDAVRNTPAIYATMCPACRLFGSTAHAGLLQLQDAWPTTQAREEVRKSIAIDRFSGEVKHGPFTYLPLSAGSLFGLTVCLQGAEMWHLGLLALVCREMSEGAARIGSGARKGLGHIHPTWRSLTVRLPIQHSHSQHREASDLYDWITQHLEESDGVRLLPSNGWQDCLWRTYEVTGSALDALKSESVANAFGPRLRDGGTAFDYSPNAQGG